MERIAATTLAIGAALITGALVQVYFSDLPPLSAWSAPALYSFLAVTFLIIAVRLLFR